MADLLPVGTYVQVTPHPNKLHNTPYRALVAGYDIHRTKYRLRTQLWPGTFTKEALSWAFPGEVEAAEDEAKET